MRAKDRNILVAIELVRKSVASDSAWSTSWLMRLLINRTVCEGIRNSRGRGKWVELQKGDVRQSVTDVRCKESCRGQKKKKRKRVTNGNRTLSGDCLHVRLGHGSPIAGNQHPTPLQPRLRTWPSSSWMKTNALAMESASVAAVLSRM